MNAPLIPESEDFLYWDPEAIGRYPEPPPEGEAEVEAGES